MQNTIQIEDYVTDGWKIMKKLFTVCVALVVAMTMMAENMTCSDAATAALALGGGVTATDSVTVTGYVSVLKGDVSTKYETPQQQFCMDDTKGSNAETLLIYWANIPEEFRESLTSLNVGDKVSVTGLLCHYVKKRCFYSGIGERQCKNAGT